MTNDALRLAAAVLMTFAVTSAPAQTVAKIDFESVGRAWPLAADLNTYHVTGATLRRALGNPAQRRRFRPIRGAIPKPASSVQRAAVRRLPASNRSEVDLFTTSDFYKDRALWSDPRYFRCNSSAALEDFWGEDRLIGEDPPKSAPWGYCDRDYPREAIVSPYPFKTAQEHYEALLEETGRRGGPTEHTYATVPGEWTGRYLHPARAENQYWFRMRHVQIPTVLSVLTPEYQKRMVQEAYHHGHTNRPQWPSQYCWPEGFLRRWHESALWEQSIMVTPSLVQIAAGVARNFVTNIHVGREFKMDGAVPRLGQDVPRWYGETIGFWDGDALITWTSNIQGWATHAAFEHSNRMQTIEIYTPNRDGNDAFVGLNHETILYDPEALAEPVRIIRNIVKLSGFEQGDPQPFIECVQTIFPIEGASTPITPGTKFEYEMPDCTGAPGRTSGSSTGRRASSGRRRKMFSASSERILRGLS